MPKVQSSTVPLVCNEPEGSVGKKNKEATQYCWELAGWGAAGQGKIKMQSWDSLSTSVPLCGGST